MWIGSPALADLRRNGNGYGLDFSELTFGEFMAGQIIFAFAQRTPGRIMANV